MSEAHKDRDALEKIHQVGPDFFSFYAREAALLTQGEDVLPSVSPISESLRMCKDIKDEDITGHYCNGKEANGTPGSHHLFSNGIGSGLSDIKRERLESLLRQGVDTLSRKVDEVSEPVMALDKIRSHLRGKRNRSSNLGPSSDCDAIPCSPKKPRKSLSSSTGLPASASPMDVESSEKIEEPLGSSVGTEEENEEDNSDLQYLLEHDSVQVTQAVKKYSDELSAKLIHMETQLEKLLNIVTSYCRPMTSLEKQHLRNVVQKLNPRDLNRIVDIIQHSKLAEGQTCEEIRIDLGILDDPTLWKLYYYTEAVDCSRSDT